MIIIVLLLLAGAAVGYWRWPSQRRTLLYGGLFSLPLVIVEFLLTGGMSRLGSTAGEQLGQVAMVVVGMMSIGALITLAIRPLVQRWWGMVAHPERHQLWWLAAGTLVAATLFLFHQPAPVALMVGLAINAWLVITIEHYLLWDAVVSSFGFAILFIVLDLVFGIRASGDISRLLIGQTSIGLTVFGLPLERLLTVGLLGAMIGPLFSATKFHRAPDTTHQRRPSFKKVFVVLVLIVLIGGPMAYAAPIYIIAPAATIIQPPAGASSVPVLTSINVTFNRPINRQALDLEMTPPADGSWTFDQPTRGDHGFRQATFTFSDPLPAATTFHVRLSGIQSIWKLPGRDLAWQFSTESAPAPVATQPIETPVTPPVTPSTITNAAEPVAPTPAPAPAPTPTPAPTKHILSIAEDYQDQALSCEAAALKMALAGHGVHVSETDIMKVVGYDPTPHVGNVWGDPNVAFVGNIDGRQNTTGYGVHWGPIAKAANHWRPATAITNGTLKQIAQAIYAGNPVVIWGTIGPAYRNDWQTPSGKTVLTWKGEHARTVIGVIGTADNPTSFVINDPVAGRVTWSAAKLNANWASFNRSGVIVE